MNHAAFLVSEAINEAKDSKTPLYAATLDVEKAFDVVNHNALLLKLFLQGLPGRFWQLKDNSYTNMTSKVKWEGTLSEKFNINQGTRQGGLCSTDDYLTYLHDGIELLNHSSLGFHIGSTSIAAPTCADDMIILSSQQHELQILLSLITSYANNLHYTIHPEKSHIIPFNLPSKSQLSYLQKEQPWHISETKAPVLTDSVHLGNTER